MDEIYVNMKKDKTDLYIERVANIDIQIIKANQDNPEVLLYLFPLIEKTFIEILKFFPFTSPEIDGQGRYRTINSILNDEKSLVIFGDNNYHILFLKELFKEEGLRNRLFHIFEDLTISVEHIHKIITLLAYLMRCFNICSKANFWDSSYKIDLIN